MCLRLVYEFFRYYFLCSKRGRLRETERGRESARDEQYSLLSAGEDFRFLDFIEIFFSWHAIGDNYNFVTMFLDSTMRLHTAVVVDDATIFTIYIYYIFLSYFVVALAIACTMGFPFSSLFDF